MSSSSRKGLEPKVGDRESGKYDLRLTTHESLIYLNGSYLPPSEARLPVADRGLAYGDGVFTTMKVSGGAPVFLERHLARLVRDAAAIRLVAPVEEVETACLGLVSRLGMEAGVLKAVLTRGLGPRGLSTRNASKPSLIVSASALPEPRPPLRVISVPDERGPLVAHKTLNYLPNILALRLAEEAGCEEAVFVQGGLLLEATVSNLIGEVEGRLLTPPLGGRVLGGVVREVLLEEGVVGEGELPADTWGPLYCTNAVRGVEPIAGLDGRPLRLDTEKQSLLEEALTRRARLARAD
ncbi:MAG: aminotransferase class IV [Actinomycetota bacterium]|nr:aminotransferase class IV [Actinomycetota bacterium]